MAVTAIIGAALALYGAYASRRGQQKNERARREANDFAQAARKSAIRELGSAKTFGMAENYFPGLVAPPTGLVRAEQKIRKHGENTRDPAMRKFWQKKENSIQRQLNPWDYLKESGYAGTPNKPGGVPVGGAPLGAPASKTPSAPMTAPLNTTAPTHGGVDPTALPTDVQAGGLLSTNPTSAPAGGTLPTAPAGPQVGGASPQPDVNMGQDAAPPVLTPKKQKKADAKAKRGAKNPFSAPETTGREGQVYPGQLATGHLMDLLQNPGRLESTTYERAQEQSNQGLNAMVAQSMGRLTGLGVDPRSGVGQTTMESGALSFARERNEAARDYSIAQEDLRRRDVQQGMDDYLSFLTTIFGMQGKKSAAKMPPGNEAFQAGTPGNSAMAQGAAASAAGSAISNYGGASKTDGGTQFAGGTKGMGGQDVAGNVTYYQGGKP